MKKNNNIFSAQYPSGIAFVGSILIGLGVGMITHKIPAYVILGLGIGFILVAIITYISNRNHFLNR